MPTTTCSARTRSGAPCQAHAGPNGLCWAHDPDLRSKRQQARSAGGKARHRRHITWGDDHRPAVHIESVADVLALLERALLAEVALENSHSRNRTIGSLCMVALKALEVGAIEERLSALEVAQHAQTLR